MAGACVGQNDHIASQGAEGWDPTGSPEDTPPTDLRASHQALLLNYITLRTKLPAHELLGNKLKPEQVPHHAKPYGQYSLFYN